MNNTQVLKYIVTLEDDTLQGLEDKVADYMENTLRPNAEEDEFRFKISDIVVNHIIIDKNISYYAVINYDVIDLWELEEDDD